MGYTEFNEDNTLKMDMQERLKIYVEKLNNYPFNLLKEKYILSIFNFSNTIQRMFKIFFSSDVNSIVFLL